MREGRNSLSRDHQAEKALAVEPGTAASLAEWLEKEGALRRHPNSVPREVGWALERLQSRPQAPRHPLQAHIHRVTVGRLCSVFVTMERKMTGSSPWLWQGLGGRPWAQQGVSMFQVHLADADARKILTVWVRQTDHKAACLHAAPRPREAWFAVWRIPFKGPSSVFHVMFENVASKLVSSFPHF